MRIQAALSALSSWVWDYSLPVRCLRPTRQKTSAKSSRPRVKLGRPVDFQRDVYPFLEANCVGCHNVAIEEGKLNLEEVETILKGGKHGAVDRSQGSGQKPALQARLPLPKARDAAAPQRGRCPRFDAPRSRPLAAVDFGRGLRRQRLGPACDQLAASAQRHESRLQRGPLAPAPASRRRGGEIRFPSTMSPAAANWDNFTIRISIRCNLTASRCIPKGPPIGISCIRWPSARMEICSPPAAIAW